MAKRRIPALRPTGTVNSTEAARLLGVSRPTFFRYRREPDFPKPLQIGKGGRQSLYRVQDLEEWRDRRVEAEHTPPGVGKAKGDRK